MNKPKVGQVVYFVTINDSHHHERTIVVKVGRKYFYCNKYGKDGPEHLTVKVEIDTWTDPSSHGYGPYYTFCESKQEWLDEYETREIVEFIRNRFAYNVKTPPLNDLRQIKAMLEREY